MSDENNIPEQYRDATRYRILEGGAVYGIEEKRIVAHLGGKYQIKTSAQGLEYLQRRITISQAAKVRAFAKKQGVDVDNATDEELLAGYSDAQEAIHGKAYDVYMDAKSARGIEGLYPKLIDEEKSAAVVVQPVYHKLTPEEAANVRILERVARDVLALHAKQAAERANAIEGEVRDA